MSDEEYRYSDNDEGGGEEYNYSDGEEEEEPTTPARRRGCSSSTTPTPSSAASSSAGALVAGAPTYLILKREDIHKNQTKTIKAFQELLNTQFHITQRILMQFQWNEELLMNTFMEHGLDRILQVCGLKPQVLSTSSKSSFPINTTTCGVCMDEYSMDLLPPITNKFCGHTFCKSCWQGHCLAKISDGKTKNILCCAQACVAIVDPELIQLVLPRDALLRYEEAMMDSYIDDNPTKAIWCPSKPNCGRAIVLQTFSSQKMDCECICGEEVFCFACKGTPSHSPVPCDWANEWIKKCESESENATFILANCKPCPKCKKPIQKGDGCNHVTCICGQYMCWLCGAATGLSHTYSSIEGHSCESYRASPTFKKGAEMKEKLDLYIHYFEKYEIHMQSLRKAREKESEVNATMDALNSRAGIIGESELADWLWIGLKQLFRMRRFVAWTYVLAYFSFYEETGKRILLRAEEGFDPQTLFETLQTKLQNSVEDLSLYVEMKPEKMDSTTKAKVLSLCHNTHQQASNLWNFCNNDVLQGAQTGNAYFPIKRMVTGLGAKVIHDSSHAKPFTVVTNAKMEVEEDEEDAGEIATTAAAAKPKKKSKTPRWMNNLL
ncbi:hypothetical protein BASA81_005490 [Batrachochytrium salamandrivorans]|nr:hypothetical protein BASA81_005490 [Batrachochytrium salamandrivorans]